MNNTTNISGWLGTGVADLPWIGGPATAMAGPRHGQAAVFGDGIAARRSGVQQLA